ncbi:MAG: hypothetical protein QNJ92_17400 [Alphaproteobacteria bacterium]|nr:hypothetical protein [Alphaproteobacteria bacterium]
MKIGDTIESAAWLTGEETAQDVEQHRTLVREAMDDLCQVQGFRHGPVRFHELKPGDERVPEVPDHIQGLDVRLLVGEAEVTAKRVKLERRPFIGELDRKDLERLRKITRRAHAKARPGETLTDLEVDDIIEQLGPEAALDTLRQQVNGQTLH